MISSLSLCIFSSLPLGKQTQVFQGPTGGPLWQAFGP